MSTAGFVTATLRAATVAGRVAAPPPAPPVYVAPDKPENLAGSLVTGSTFWSVYCDPATSNDDYPVIGYYWYENDVLVGQSSTPEFTKLERTPSTAYTITARAYTVGAVSDLSDPLVITTDASGGTPPAVDTRPPTSPVLNSVVVTGPYAATASWDLSTDTETGVSFYILCLDGQPTTAAAHPLTSASWGAFAAGRQYSITIIAVDGAGNRSAPSNAILVTLPGVVVVPPPGRTISGAMADTPPILEGNIVNVPPSPPGRSIAGFGTAAIAATTITGSITNVPVTEAPPVWTSPASDTTYSYNEGDNVDITLSATSPQGRAVAIAAATGRLPSSIALGVTGSTYKLTGTLPAGSGGYPDPVDYDSTYDANDDVAVPLLDITTTSIPAGTANQDYSVTFAGTGGYGPPYFWALTTVLPGSLATELTMNPTTGELAGRPSAAFSGPIEVTCTDPRSNVKTKQFTLTINPVAADDQAARFATDGTLFATNFRDVYLGSGTGPAVLTPARQITSITQLTSAPYSAGGHRYSAAEGLYGQVRDGVLQGPFPDQWPRAELDTTTFPFPTLRLPGRVNDGKQGGAWTAPVNGVNATLYRRIYFGFRVLFDEEAIATKWDESNGDHKIFMLGSNQDGQIVLGSKGNCGALTMFWDVFHSIGEIPGVSISSSNNPWANSVRRTYNAFDMGDTTLDGTQNTAEMQRKFLENYGPLDGGYNPDTSYGYLADDKYLARRSLAIMPYQYPDVRAFKNAPALRPWTWYNIRGFAEKHVGEGFYSIEHWIAEDNQPLVKLFTAIHNVPCSVDDTRFTEFQVLEYSTNRVRGTALDRNTWYREMQTSLKPIPSPGGFLPPNNQG